MKYLFWNTGKKQVNSYIEDLLDELSCDVVGLAEYNDDLLQLLKGLSARGLDYYYIDKIGCQRIDILSKFTPGKVVPIYETSYYSIKEFPHDKLGTVIIAFVHLRSKLHSDTSAENLSKGQRLKLGVEEAENRRGHSRTVVVGDFNMNPFEDGMIAAMGLHSVPCRKIAATGSRRVSDIECSMFYNPMWNLLGDEDAPPGTYFYNSGGEVNYFWNIFDQVIIRPQLIPSYVAGSAKIVTEVNSIKLVTGLGRPNNAISDHLPITFAIG
jgi:hypothetical protein